MKNKLFSLAFLFVSCTLSICVKAQLSVDATGNVRISKRATINGADISDSIALNVVLPQSSSLRNYGIYSSFYLPNTFFGDGCKVGVVGQVKSATPPVPRGGLDPQIPVLYKFSAGVAGVASSGIGVYGATASDLPSATNVGTYAGYFSGNAKVTGTLTAAIVTQTSDMRFKENISELSNDQVYSLISKLTPVSYSFRKDSNNMLYLKDIKASHYGFIAQEVQKVAPELVYEDEMGYLSINYSEIIPLLIKEVQSLSSEITEMKAQKAQQQMRKRSESTNEYSFDGQATLYQNTPNPFSEDTKIEYQLPQSTQRASLYIYNMNGLQVAEYPIASYGTQSIVINGGYLEAGMYLYSLIADGQVIDTKRMILTR